jgi:alanine dehydrogenase
MKVIADVSCDLIDPIPCTLRPSKIADPVYGYNPFTGKEEDAYQEKNIMVMAIDNLPGELPRDASEDFASAVYEHLIPALVGEDKEGVVERATILKHGKLTPKFSYLKEYLEGN